MTDLLDNQQKVFFCQSWLGIGIGDGTVDKTFVAAGDEELKDFETLFLANISRGFCDDHLWFSITMRPPRSHFTCCQRVSCCLCILLCTMLANAMFYQTSPVKGNQVSFGSVTISLRQIVIGIQSALIVIAVDILIDTLFRKAAPTQRTESEGNIDQKAIDRKTLYYLQSLIPAHGINLVPKIFVERAEGGEYGVKRAIKSQRNGQSESLHSLCLSESRSGNEICEGHLSSGKLSAGLQNVRKFSQTRLQELKIDYESRYDANRFGRQSMIPVPVFRTYSSNSSFECLRSDSSDITRNIGRMRSNESTNDNRDAAVRETLLSKGGKTSSFLKPNTICIQIEGENHSRSKWIFILNLWYYCDDIYILNESIFQ